MTSRTWTPSTIRRPRHFDLRVLLGLALALVAASGSIAYWGVATDTRGVLVATRDLPAGTTLAAGDLAVARVHLDDALYAAALPANELAPTVGRRLADPAHTGQVLARGQLATHPLLGPDQLALTIAVRPETAAGGRLRQGDNVRVLVTRDKGKPDSSTATVLERVIVYEVGYDPRLAVEAIGNGQAGDSESGPLASVTLVVTPEQATQLANAKWNGDLDVALLPPEPSRATPTPADTR